MKEILKFNKKGIDYCVFLTDKGEFYLKTQYGGGIIDINLKITKYREEVQYIKKFGRTLKVSRKIPLETAYCLSIGEGDFPQLKEALGLNPQNKLNVIIPDAIQKQIPKILEMQTNARKEFIKSQKEKLLDQGIEIAFVQEVCRYDGDVFVTDSYTLNPEDEEELRKFDFTDKEINQIYRYCRDKGLFSEDKVFVGVGNYGNNVYATIKKVLLNKEIYENAKYYITEGELPKIKEEIKSIKDKLANEIEILKDIFVGKVHVDEMGYFSKCPDYCDDCFWREHIKGPYYNEDYVKQNSPTFFVKSNTKTYTYYKPTKEVLMYLKEKHKDEVTKYINKLEGKLLDLERKVAIYENFTNNTIKKGGRENYEHKTQKTVKM